MNLRPARDFFFHLAVAVFGVRLIEDSISPLFPRPTDIVGAYKKEFIMDAAVSLVIGFLICLKWRQRAALWVWIVGLCVFASRFVYRFDMGASGVAGMVSVRCVFYSLGATAFSLSSRRSEKVASTTI